MKLSRAHVMLLHAHVTLSCEHVILITGTCEKKFSKKKKKFSTCSLRGSVIVLQSLIDFCGSHMNYLLVSSSMDFCCSHVNICPTCGILRTINLFCFHVLYLPSTSAQDPVWPRQFLPTFNW